MKLERLDARYAAHKNETGGDARLRRLSMISLKWMINQFKEELARYEAHHPASNGAV